MTPSNTAAYVYATAISGDRVAIGAPELMDGKGQVYLYSLPDLNETILQYSPQGKEVHGYGRELDLFGDILVVGALLVYEFQEGAFDLVVELPSYDSLARVVTDGRTIVVETPDYGPTSSAALVYGRDPSVTVVGAPATSPNSDTEGKTGTEPEGEKETEGVTETQAKGEAGTGNGKNQTGTGSETAASSASALCGSLLNIVFLTMVIAHFAVRHL